MNVSKWNSVVSARDLLTQNDTSLALSAAGQTATSSAKSIRVKDQIKVSLSRKATQKNGGFSQNKSTRVVGVTNANSSKLNGSSSYGGSVTSNLKRGPTKRIEVTPPPSPKLSSPSRFNLSMYTSKIQSSRLGQSLVAGNVKNFHRSTSEPYNLKKAPNPTSVPPGRSIRQTGGPQARFPSRAFRQTVGMKSVRQTVVKPNIHINRGFSDPGDNLPWLTQLRKNCQKSTFQISYPPSVASTEVELPFEATQTKISGLKKNPEMTVDEALFYLTQNNEEKLVEATSCLQRTFFQGSGWKEKEFKPLWIKQLLQLLIHDNEVVPRVSAGVLRVIVYQNDENKIEVDNKEGLNIITKALKRNKDKETRQHLTGLLWSLSSHDKIKESFSKENIDVLTNVILVPSSGIYRGENPKDDLAADPEAFYNATGCLRNLSSAGPNIRDQMRECRNLVDSIVCHIRLTAADRLSDDESTGNCICILQNLAYGLKPKPQLSSESDNKSRESVKPEKTSTGCFSSLSPKEETPLSKPPELSAKANPVGIEWLWSPIMIRTYLSLMACSKQESTREGAMGALQNITSGNCLESEAIADFIVHKEDGLRKIKNVLEEKVCEKQAAQLIRNLSRHSIVQDDIVKHALSDVVKMLPNDDRGVDQPRELTACLCQILINLTRGGIKNAKAIIDLKALTKINNIARINDGSDPSQAGRAACILMQLMWQQTALHSYIRKVSGLKKKHFINKRTNAVMESEEKKRKLSNC
uniref:Plakophilin-2 n=1 Tax=Oryzias latipes TaxID=8090 RepID=A0A3P9LA23_ORYLA